MQGTSQRTVTLLAIASWDTVIVDDHSGAHALQQQNVHATGAALPAAVNPGLHGRRPHGRRQSALDFVVCSHQLATISRDKEACGGSAPHPGVVCICQAGGIDTCLFRGQTLLQGPVDPRGPSMQRPGPRIIVCHHAHRKRAPRGGPPASAPPAADSMHDSSSSAGSRTAGCTCAHSLVWRRISDTMRS
jgi:hypothetical protein